MEVANQGIITNVENDIQVYKITSVLTNTNDDINGDEAEIQETTIIEINPIKEESFRGFFCKVCGITYDSKIRFEAHQEIHKIDQVGFHQENIHFFIRFGAALFLFLIGMVIR